MSKRGTGKPNGPITPWKHRVKASRRKDAEARQAKYNALTPEQKLTKLDAGMFFAKKERAKIHAQMKKNVVK